MGRVAELGERRGGGRVSGPLERSVVSLGDSKVGGASEKKKPRPLLYPGAVAPPPHLEEVARAMTMACSSPLMKVKGFFLVSTK